ncbi:hypothetical protein [Halomonas sp.]|uniref:hypothetical protein n=1 Tax=Halomonas sp. TaxID=1486246 RepID=UPI003A911123
MRLGLKLEEGDLKAIVSHEHIHYLQYLDNVFMKNETSNRKIKNGSLIFSESSGVDKMISSYLFAEYEVEARFHELIVNYYRKYNHLPLSIHGMVSLVFQSPSVLAAEFPGYKTEQLSRWKIQKINKKVLSSYRSDVISVDIMIMSESFKDKNASVRYMYEVLPIFYSRLLRYYGDSEASRRFSNQIVRPNFYDQLYGGTSVDDC